MAINFPDSPTNGQQTSAGGNTWQYNSTKSVWEKTLTSGRSSASLTTYATISELPLSGVSAGQQAFVTGSNRMYVSNGTGWYSISLVNTNPAITAVQDASAGTTPFTLAIDGTATVITVTASDPEEIPLTYNYSVTSGSLTNGGGTTATVVQGTGANTNQFTITPTTTEAYAGTFELTFTTSDGINQASSVNSFTLQFITTITNSKYTTLLATAVDTSDNNNITDASSNSHSITVNGDAYAGTFSPYRSGGYATSFSRSASSKLEIASMPAIGSGDCSIEAWINIESSSVEQGIILRGVYNSVGGLALTTRAAGGELMLLWSGSIYVTSGANIVADKWHWIQVIKSSGTVTIYVNGSSVGSWSNSANVSSTSNYIIGRAQSYFDGQIRDLRISTNAQSSSSGSEKLETDSNTTFLSCHLPYLSYATSSVASNSYSSNSGTIETVSNSPYDYEEYAAADHGGAINFDGTGDALRIADNSNIQLGTSSFTIEGWFYCNDTTPTQGILAKRDGSSEYWRWIIAGGNLNFRFQSVGGGSFTFNTVSVPTKTWCHFAVTRDSNNDVRQFVNGISTQNAINSTGNFDISGSSLRVGEYELNTGHFSGFVSDIKIIKNSALYTTDFTPPTVPLSSSGASLHIQGTDASIVDKAQGYNLRLYGNTTGSTDQVRSGDWVNTKTMKFDGTGDYITADADAGNFGTGDFTIETWLRPSGWGRALFRKTTSTSSSSPPSISVYIAVGSILTGVNSGTADGTWISGTNPFTLNTWGHLAITRVSGLVTVYANGSSIVSATRTADVDNGITFRIGEWRNSTEYFSGYIQDFRITKGLARYTANFTPPTASLEG